MRVVRVLTRPNLGGPVRHLGSLDAALRDIGVDCLLLTGCGGSGEADAVLALEQQGAEVERIPELRPSLSPRALYSASRAIFRRISAYRPDLVHTHTAVAGMAGRLAGLRARLPLVHTFHGHTFRGGYWSWPVRRALLAMERWAGRRTDCLVAVAEQVRSELEDLGLRPKRYWKAIHPAPLLHCAPARPDPTSDLLFVGRLVPVKGVDVLLRALATLPGRSLVIAGDGPERASLERLCATLGLSTRVRFQGWVENPSALMSSSRLLVLPSRNEGWPIALLEAAANGLPFLATDVGGCREMVAKLATGLLCPPGSIDALAEGIERSLSSPEVRETAWPPRVLSSPVVAAAEHRELYESLVCGSPP